MAKIIKITLVILCMALIFWFSSDTADDSTKKSDGFIVKTCEFVLGRELTEAEKEKYIEELVFIVRKGAHFSIYLVLGLLIMSYFKEIYLVNKKGLLIAFIICFLYACSDEIHQLFVPGRSGEIKDVLIDSCGSFIGIHFYYFVSMIRRRLHE